MTDHLPFAFFFSESACGSNCYTDWFSVTADVLANLVVADNCDVSADDVGQLFRFDFAAQFELRLLDPVLAYCIPTLFDATRRTVVGDVI